MVTRTFFFCRFFAKSRACDFCEGFFPFKRDHEGRRARDLGMARGVGKDHGFTQGITAWFLFFCFGRILGEKGVAWEKNYRVTFLGKKWVSGLENFSEVSLNFSWLGFLSGRIFGFFR
jgi:hypothetical protein